MTLIRLPLAVLAALVLSLSLLVSPAQAESASRQDPLGDAPARLDAAAVVYDFRHRVMRMTVYVPELERRGLVQFGIGIPRSDGITVATLRVRRNGSLGGSYVRLDYDGNTRVPCSVGGFWNARTGRVMVTVPRACVRRGLTDADRLWFQGSVGVGRRTDHLRSRVLRAG